jgi:hypothetical protein
MLRESPSAPGLDADISAPDLASLVGMPGEPELLDDLRAAVGAYTGFGTVSPLAAEIAGAVVAAVMAVMLIERPPPGGGTWPGLGSQAARLEMPGVAQAWRDLAAAGQVQDVARSGYGAARMSMARMATPPTDGQVCGLFAVDIVGFTRPDRDDDIRLHLHEELYKFLQKAFDDSDIPWADCFCEDRGDGALVVVPPGIAFKAVIDPLPERLRRLVRRHNHLSSQAAGLQLRAAAHIGPVEHDGHGFVGSDVNFLFRMLDARSVKRTIAETGADLALIVSDHVYRSLVCRYPSLISPEAFQAVRFQTKKTRGQAWTYLPGTPR